MNHHRWPLILLCALALLVSSAATQRRPLKVLEAVIDGEPNAAQLRAKVGQWVTDRWVDGLSKPAAAPSPRRPSRYWGAQ